ncbi:MAG: response regulator [Actinobacteria bacterium]|nr:response regulator [Actinomycetota bacterium]
MSDLPRGTVTLLFTDIEASTALVQRLGESYAEVLVDHRRLVRGAAEGAGGVEIECRADELFIAFPSARDAVSAAVEAQRALLDHPWPAEVDLRVRMGLHTGEPIVRDDAYLGVDVHRAARICSAGHGGQILLSQTTHDLVADGDLGIEELGEHELRGLPGRERIYQLVVPGLAAEFPPLRVDVSESSVGDFTFQARAAPPDAAAAPPADTDGRVRVVLADDAALLRQGLARLLEEAGFEIVAQSGTAEDLLRHVAMHRPDVAVVDIRMPPTQTDEGLRAAETIRERFPDVGVLVLSQYVEPAYALQLLSESAEGVGYLLKDRVSDLDEFAAAVRRVAEGGSALDPSVVQMLVGRRRKADPLDELTPREREVLELMAEGRSNQAIAERLFVTLRAVEKHVTSIFSKLRLPPSAEDHRRVLAVLASLRS